MSLIKKIWQNRWVFRSIIPTVYFNLRMLPFRQAVKLPILLYKPHFKSLKGKVTITPTATTGMITLGRNQVPLYPNTGITLDLRGSLVFGGYACIGNASSLSIAPTGSLSLGKGVVASAAFKVASYCQIEIDEFCRFGWDCMLLDSDFHKLTLADGTNNKGFKAIHINSHCWLGTECLVLKGTQLPPYTTVQARTTLSGDYTKFGRKCVIGETRTVNVKAMGTYRDVDNDKIDYENQE